MQEKTVSLIDQYREHPLYRQAARFWKSAAFSQLAVYEKKYALEHIARHASFHPLFLKGCMKLLIPRQIWQTLRKQV